MAQIPHISVLLQETLQVFEDSALRVFVDATLGAGGHAEAILTAHPEIEMFIGIDQDPEALKIAADRLTPFKSKIQLLQGNFSDLALLLKERQITQVDGIMVDLGVSSMQLDQAGRGFSFMRDGPLDMRMGPAATETAADIVNTRSEKELLILMKKYGEVKEARRIAAAIVAARTTAPFQTTRALAQLIEKTVGYNPKKIHPATLVFQALRIAVNRELERLESFLPQALKLLRPHGRLAAITFHSLEDRIVKQEFVQLANDKESTSGLSGLFIDKKPEIEILTRKPLEASDEEKAENPRSRSAKLRAFEKLP